MTHAGKKEKLKKVEKNKEKIVKWFVKKWSKKGAEYFFISVVFCVIKLKNNLCCWYFKN